MDKNILEAVCWYFGMTKKEARIYIKSTDNAILKAIVKGYGNHCKRAFYND